MRQVNHLNQLRHNSSKYNKGGDQNGTNYIKWDKIGNIESLTAILRKKIDD